MKNINIIVTEKPKECRPFVPTITEKQLCDFSDHWPGITNVFQHGIRKIAVNALNESSHHYTAIVSLRKNFHLTVRHAVGVDVDQIVTVNRQAIEIPTIISKIKSTSFGQSVDTDVFNDLRFR